MLRRFILIPAVSLLASLAIAAAVAVAGVILLWLIWEIFGICAVFGGTMEGSCGYAFTFFFLPITVLTCLLSGTIIAFGRLHPWFARRLSAPRQDDKTE